MSEFSEWRQVGATQQRLYSDGTLGCVHNISREGRWTHFIIKPSGFMDDLPCGQSGYNNVDDAKGALDYRFDPQPEVLLRSETVSVFKMNGRESIAIKSKFCNEWFARNVNSKSMTREEAEERAKDWLKQQARGEKSCSK